jgi:SPP1 family predicted phage head-tail adaptor
MLNSGNYRQLIEILEYRKTGDKNELGEDIYIWVVVKQIFGSFENRTGNMLYGRAGDSKLANTTHKLSYRYANYPMLNEDNKLRIEGRTYKIDYIDDLDNRHETIEAFLHRDNLRK